MDPNMADRTEQIGAERLDAVTVRYIGDDLFDVVARRNGWAPGVYRKRFPNGGI
jgi:hypothetical protein